MSIEALLRALAGGALIGLAASVALVGHGRIAGISGTLGRALDRDGGAPFRIPFLAGLLGVGLVLAVLVPSHAGSAIRDVRTLAVAGLLVGGGTTLGNGCTSGHGVCGVARGSARSIVAVVVFMTTGALTVALVGAHA